MHSLDKLLAEICVGMDPAEAKAIVENSCLTIAEVPISLYPAGAVDPDGLHAYCGMGASPSGEAGPAAMRRLLELNLYLFRRGGSGFGVDIERDEVVMMTRLDRRGLTSERLLEGLFEMAGIVRSWQATHFADGSLADDTADPWPNFAMPGEPSTP